MSFGLTFAGAEDGTGWFVTEDGSARSLHWVVGGGIVDDSLLGSLLGSSLDSLLRLACFGRRLEGVSGAFDSVDHLKVVSQSAGVHRDVVSAEDGVGT